MTEIIAVARSKTPITRDSLIADLTTLGITPGMTLLVHTAMSRIGWVCGGARTVIEALLATLGPTGTLVMPAQSSELSDPSGWCHPPVPEHWWPIIRDTMPAYDPRLTPTRGVGIIAETFRLWPGTRRSLHPQVSFTANGPLATEILSSQPLQDPFGPISPLARLHERNAHILMIGTDWTTCTALHLAERLAFPDSQTFEDGAPILRDGEREWARFRLPETDTDRFPPIGAKLDATLTHGHVGEAPSRLVPMRAAITTALDLLSR